MPIGHFRVPQCLFQSESKCETFVMIISFNLNMNETDFHNKDFALSLALIEMEAEVNSKKELPQVTLMTLPNWLRRTVADRPDKTF